jgi:hypothetical protein
VNRHDVFLYVIATRRHLEYVASVSFLDIPVYRHVAQWGGWHPLRDEPGSAEANAATLAAAAAAVRDGSAVTIFAQGFTDEIGSGGVRIAAAAGAPLLPVFVYRVQGPPAHPRALIVVHRPLPPPAPGARARRRFRDRLRRRMRALGALRHQGHAADIVPVALDDAALWKDPLRVLRLSARVPRLPAEVAAPLARRARHLRRGCARLRCAVDDLRRPAGLAQLAALGALLLPALAGGLLCVPPVLALALRLRRRPAQDFRTALMRLALSLAVPWGIVLAAVGVLAWGAPGLWLPLVAAAGVCCLGPFNRLRRRLRGAVVARRHGHRLRAPLAAFDALLHRAWKE